jgi:hypothetical protein
MLRPAARRTTGKHRNGRHPPGRLQRTRAGRHLRARRARLQHHAQHDEDVQLRPGRVPRGRGVRRGVGRAAVRGQGPDRQPAAGRRHARQLRRESRRQRPRARSARRAALFHGRAALRRTSRPRVGHEHDRLRDHHPEHRARHLGTVADGAAVAARRSGDPHRRRRRAPAGNPRARVQRRRDGRARSRAAPDEARQGRPGRRPEPRRRDAHGHRRLGYRRRRLRRQFGPRGTRRPADREGLLGRRLAEKV